jgi:flagellar basal-body rod protein FlgB
MKLVEGEAPMFEKLEITRMAQSLASYAGARQDAVARNVANADTPGYKAMDMPGFAETYAEESPMRATRPGHMMQPGSVSLAMVRTAGSGSSPNGNTVSLEGEMVKAVEVKAQHEMALAIYRSTSDVIRASLGRGR